LYLKNFKKESSNNADFESEKGSYMVYCQWPKMKGDLIAG